MRQTLDGGSLGNVMGTGSGTARRGMAVAYGTSYALAAITVLASLPSGGTEETPFRVPAMFIAFFLFAVVSTLYFAAARKKGDSAALAPLVTSSPCQAIASSCAIAAASLAFSGDIGKSILALVVIAAGFGVTSLSGASSHATILASLASGYAVLFGLALYLAIVGSLDLGVALGLAGGVAAFFVGFIFMLRTKLSRWQQRMATFLGC